MNIETDTEKEVRIHIHLSLDEQEVVTLYNWVKSVADQSYGHSLASTMAMALYEKLTDAYR